MVEYPEAQLDAVFGAFAHGTRRAILRRLARGDATVTELAAPFRMSLQAVSKHLKVLERAALVRREKDGRVRRMHLEQNQVRAADAWIRELESMWDTRFDRLDRLLAESPDPAQEQRRGK